MLFELSSYFIWPNITLCHTVFYKETVRHASVIDVMVNQYFDHLKQFMYKSSQTICQYKISFSDVIDYRQINT